MSASIIDQPVEDKADTAEEAPATLAEVVAPVKEQPDKAAEPAPGVDDVPAKYKGKSIQDVIQMHQNAESLAGRQSSEVGDLRKIVDDFIVTQSNSTKELPKEDETLDFLDDPDAAVARAIENHPSIVRANEIAKTHDQSNANQEAQQRLLEAHPDTAEVISDARFVDWVQGSKLRTRALRDANQSNNVESMSELLSEYKATRPAPKETTDLSYIVAKGQQAKQAATGAITGNSQETRKVYRRADLIKLKMNDPDRYSLLQPEIMQAYAEDRVI
jgi:hypothetical protein